MTLDQLRVFVAVAEREHMTRAAEALNMTQSTASAAINTFERTYGVKLFHRVGRRIELTEEGRTFYKEALGLLQHSKLLTGMLADLRGSIGGTLSISASPTIASYWLPNRLSRFKAAYAECEVSLSASPTASVIASVIDGKSELGFVGSYVHNNLLQVEEVGRDYLHIVVGRDHPWSQKAEMTVDDLKNGHWVLREGGSGTRNEFVAALPGLGFDARDLDVAMELPTDEGLISAVQSGLHATVLSGLVARTAVSLGLLKVVPFPLPSRPFFSVQHRERYRSSRLTAFLAMLKRPEDVN